MEYNTVLLTQESDTQKHSVDDIQIFLQFQIWSLFLWVSPKIFVGVFLFCFVNVCLSSLSLTPDQLFELNNDLKQLCL